MTVTCPTCGDPVRGLLDTCDQPECLTADLDHERAIERRAEQ